MNPASMSPATMNLADEVGTRFGAQLCAAQLDVGEVRAILRDAIERLLTVCETASRDGSGAFAAVIPALQFQDISDQLLAHAQTRIDGLRDIVAPPRPLNQMREALDRLEAGLAKPVGAPHLDTGDVELF